MHCLVIYYYYIIIKAISHRTLSRLLLYINKNILIKMAENIEENTLVENVNGANKVTVADIPCIIHNDLLREYYESLFDNSEEHTCTGAITPNHKLLCTVKKHIMSEDEHGVFNEEVMKSVVDMKFGFAIETDRNVFTKSELEEVTTYTNNLHTILYHDVCNVHTSYVFPFIECVRRHYGNNDCLFHCTNPEDVTESNIYINIMILIK
jgi:hypothetical protein